MVNEVKTEIYNNGTGYLYAGTSLNSNWTAGGAVNTNGIFAEVRGKYPILKDVKFDSRTRIFVNNLWNSQDKPSCNATQLFTLDATQDLTKGFSLYEMAGVNINIPLGSSNVKCSPVCIFGLNKNFKISDKTSINLYGECYPLDKAACVGMSFKF